MAEISKDGSFSTPPGNTLLRQPQIMAEVPKVALFNYMLVQGESIAPNQSQEVA